MRLIDADTLGDEFDVQIYCLRWEVDNESNPNGFPHADAIDWCRHALTNVPTVDAVPVVHGRWIWHDDTEEYECSYCHDTFDYSHTYDLFDHGFQQANYCPYCGAKMDLEEPEEAK